ncbi:MAG: ATP-binding protein [Nitrospinales bacterium]
MDRDQKIKVLQSVDLLQVLSEQTLMRLCEHCNEIALEPGETLFEEGTLETSMYLILSGEIIVSKGVKQIATLGPGQYLGEMSLLESKPRSASAKAVNDTLLMEIRETEFNDYLANEPRALISMVKTLSSRIRNDLDVMADDLQKVNIFTHDIKNCLTPLGLVEMYIEDLIESFLGAQQGQQKHEGLPDLEKSFEITTIVRKNLTTMVNHSLSHARKIKIEYHKKSADILELIAETIEQISCHKYLKGKHVEMKPLNEIPKGYFNYLDIKRVLQNTIINAGYVTKDGGRIEVLVKDEDRHIRVSVVDHGCGIPEEIRHLLMKESLTTKKDGNGLGLLSCRNIIEGHHQGKFWFESEVGKGTTFHFTIPHETDGSP